MEIMEYAIGIGGWAVLSCFVYWFVTGNPIAYNPIMITFLPGFTVLFVYGLLTLIQYLVYAIFTVLQYMFRAEILIVIVSSVTTAAAIFVVSSTYIILKNNDVPIVENVD
jgi:hypothetical protein